MATTMLELVVGRWSVAIFLAVACAVFSLFSLPPEPPAHNKDHPGGASRLSDTSKQVFILLATIIAVHLIGMGNSLAEEFLDHSPSLIWAGWSAFATCAGFIVIFCRLHAKANPFISGNYTFFGAYPLFCLVAPFFFAYLSAILTNETFSLQRYANTERSFFIDSLLYVGPWFLFLLWQRIKNKKEKNADPLETSPPLQGTFSRWFDNAAKTFWIIILLLTITHYIADKDHAREYLNFPQIGDIYITKVGKIQGTGYNDSSVVGLMKLVAIDENELSFIVSTEVYRRRRWLKPSSTSFSSEKTKVAVNNLQTLYNRKIIEMIERQAP